MKRIRDRMAAAQQQATFDGCVKNSHRIPQNESIVWDILNGLHRYVCVFVRFVIVLLHGKRGKSMPPIDDRLLLEPATSIAEKIRTKQVSAVQVMTAFIRRIKQINPLLNCVVDERFEDALVEADEVDKVIASNKYTDDELRKTKPFLGVPISTKNSIGVKGMIQSSSLWARRNVRATEDAEVIRLMRAAGAIPFAITNVPELCMWWETTNTIYGYCNNPYDTNRMCGGSSGGEGSLVAASGSPFGIANDIGGSIRIPALMNGIFGHKPSALIVSNKGQWPETVGDVKLFALATGPMCRFACDLMPALKVLAGDRAKDLRLDEPVNLSHLKFFYQMDDGGANLVLPVDADIQVAMNKVMRYIQNECGAKPQSVQLDRLKHSMDLWDANLLSDDLDYDLECKLANLNGRINPYVELLKWCVGMSKHAFPVLLFAAQQRFNLKYDSPEYHRRVNECNALRREFAEMLGENGVFIYPTHPTVAPYHNESIPRAYNCGYTAIFNVLGLPCTAVPLGLGPTERMPIGLQVVANRNQDRLCLAVANELERAFGGWVAPAKN